jgi:hypothetical protein
MPDHRPFIGENFGESYQQVSAVTEYKNSTVLVFSKFNPNHMLFAGKVDWMGARVRQYYLAGIMEKHLE